MKSSFLETEAQLTDQLLNKKRNPRYEMYLGFLYLFDWCEGGDLNPHELALTRT